MINLKHRSTKKELLDADTIPFADIKKNMQELDTINRLLGGHAITLKGLDKFLEPKPKEISVCEIGCGGGDNLRAVHNYCKKKGIRVVLTGVDIKAECVTYAEERNTDLEAKWICSDYRLVTFEGKRPDVIFTSLFCHHFAEAELVSMCRWLVQHSNRGFFINDLHRHPLAYYSIKVLTQFFSSSYLVKNDAPLSVARGFKRNEWQQIMEAAEIEDFAIHWKWAFRHLIVAKHA